MSAVMRVSFSSRPTCTRRLSSSVPSPCLCQRSLTSSGEFAFVRAVQLAQSADAENFAAPPSGRFRVFGHQRDFAVVIIETNARQPLVGDALRQFQGAEIAVINAFLGEGFMELHHQRFVFRADGPDDDRRFLFFNFHVVDILNRIRADGGLGQLRFRGLRVVQDHAGIQGEDASGETSSGLMSISAIHGCSTTSWLKRTSNCSSAAMFAGCASANALRAR